MSRQPAPPPQVHATLPFVIMISCAAAVGGFLFGFDSSVINGTVEALEKAFGSGTAGTGFSVASVLLGCAVGALFAGRLANRFGRRPVMVMTSVLFVISALGCGASMTTAQFVFFRLVGGLAVGAASVIAPAYIAEVSPARLRGRLGTLQQMAIVVGIFMAFVSNYLLAYIAGGVSNELWFGVRAWRWMYWVEAVPAALYGIGALLIPESPRFLVLQGRDGEAATVLARVCEPDVPMRLREIRRTLESDHKPRLGDLLGPNGLPQRIVVVGMLLSAFQQFVGINVIFYYGAVLWSAVGLSEQNSLLINIITGTVNVGSTVVAIMFVDRVGRRPLLLAGSVGMAVTLGVMSFVFSGAPVGGDGNLQLTRTAGIVALLAANLFVFSFGVSWGPVVWVMLGEMFNNRIRAMALAVGAAVQWLANFAITMTFPLMLRGLGLGFAYGIYAAAAVLSAIFVLTMVKETKGKALEEM